MRSVLARIQRLRSEETSFVAVALTVVFGSLLGIVVLQTMIVQTRVQLDQVNADLRDAQELNQQLRIEVIELEAPDRVLDVAVDRLGMERPDDRVYLPGSDPATVQIAVPTRANPFGAGPLSDELREQLGMPVESDDE